MQPGHITIRYPFQLTRLFSFFLLFCLYANSASKTQLVEAEGSGYNLQQAIQNALRSAVEKCAGLYLESHTKVENYRVINDKILSRTNGYVSRYDTIAGSHRNEFGLVYIRVKAEVKTTSIREDLEALKLIYSLKNLPRLMVVINESAPGSKLTQRTTATVLENELLLKGFKLVDKERMVMLQEEDLKRFSDNTAAAQTGFRFGADLLITGFAEAGEAFEETVYGMKQWRAPCQMNLRLLRTDNAQVISAVSLNNDWASKSRMQAVNASLTRASMKAAEKIITDLLSFWKDEIYNTTVIEVRASGMNNNDLSPLLEKIQKISEVQKVHIRYIEGKNAVFDIEISGTVQHLRESFIRMNDIAIQAMTANRIDVIKTGQEDRPTPEIKFEVEEPDIAIASANIDPVFPCIYSYYSKKSIGNVMIRNNSPFTVSDATISAEIPRYTTLPTKTKVPSIPPGKNAPFDFKLTLDTKEIHTLNETIHAQAGISLEYQFQNRAKTRTLTMPVTIEKINAMRWSTPHMAASFITPNNPLIKTASRSALNAVLMDSIKAEEIAINELAQAAALYHAMRFLSITYVKDPHAAHEKEITDIIQYPSQTLEMKSGDCDDLSILFASLLESIGIETALIVFPDHVMVMFNTGIYEKNSIRISYNTKDYIVHNKRVWIPFETTQLQKFNFIQAWHSATGDFTNAVNEGQSVTIVDVHTAWDTYPSFDPIDQKSLPGSIDNNKIQKGFSEDIMCLEHELKQGFVSAENSLNKEAQTNPSAPVFNKFGVLYARNGNVDEAEKMFRNSLKADSAFCCALNNLANIYCLKSNDSIALIAYDKAIACYPRNPAYFINKALCLMTQNKIAESIIVFKTGIGKLKSPNDLERILGIKITELDLPLTAEQKKDTVKNEISKKRIQNVIKKVLDKVPDKEIKDFSKNILPVGGLRGADPEEIEKIADLLWWDE